MSRLHWISLVLVFGLPKWCTANYTFTNEMAAQCKEHICRVGYNYEVFYMADPEVRKVKPGAGVAFEMHIAILAASNGHILLSPVPDPGLTDPVYEFVVGGGGNGFTELRRLRKKNSKTSATTPKILSAIEYRAFFIRIDIDGVVEFWREGDKLPILSYHDNDPLTIRYFSFASWTGVEAKILFDCPTANDNGTSETPNSKQVEPKLSPSDALKKTLMQDRMTNQAPGHMVSVDIGMKVMSIRYNAFESKLETSLGVVTTWTDDSLAWNPDKFNKTTILHFRQGEIWKPSFIVSNSVDLTMLNPSSPELITVYYNGKATFHYQTKITTWCYDHKSLNRWPRDEYQCAIIFGAWNNNEIIRLHDLDSDDDKMKLFSFVDDFEQNEWEVTGSRGVITPQVWSKLFIQEDNLTQSDKYALSMKIKRTVVSYSIVFYTPLLVLVVFLLLSFWMEPLSMSRVWFYAGSAIVVCLGLSYCDYLVPCHSVASLQILYTCVLGGELLALLLNVALMTPLVQGWCKMRFAQSLLTSKVFRMVFCLPELKTCQIYESINEGFLPQEEDNPSLAGDRVEEMECEKNAPPGEKEEMAEVFDKIMFVIYSAGFSVLLACHF